MLHGLFVVVIHAGYWRRPHDGVEWGAQGEPASRGGGGGKYLVLINQQSPFSLLQIYYVHATKSSNGYHYSCHATGYIRCDS